MHSPLTKPMNVLCLGSLLSFQAGCLTLDARQSKNDCLNFQECSGLNLRKAGELSENPQKDENDESYLFEVLSPREAQDGITVIVQSQRQCRSFRETTDLYRHNNPTLFWTNVALLGAGGGAAGFGATQGDSTGTMLLAAGGALALYGVVDTSIHLFTKNLAKNRVEKGPYIACGEFAPLPDTGRVSSLFNSLNPQAPIRVSAPKAEEESRFLLEPFVMGFSILENPQQPELTIRGHQNKSHQDMTIPTPTPPKRIWLCEAMNRISAIQVAEEPSDWKIYFELEINQAPASLPWVYPDGQSVFSAHEDVLKLCPANDRNNLADIANSVIKDEPGSYPIFADALDEIIGKDLYRPDPKALYSTRKRPNLPQPQVPTKKKEKKTTKKRKKAKPVADSGKAPFGRYRCRKRARIANLYIQRDGSFSLDVELERGYAMGTCGSKRCEVKNSSGSAAAFINSASMIYISKVGRTLFINNKTQCDKIK